jgi:class 3 adenylate cyclase/tetratricopeptide (TPR) repeat protein
VSTEQQQLEGVIVGLESQRALLGDALVDAALVPLRAKLATLAAAQPSAPFEQTLKQVTVLFLDFVGSTTLSQYLDPEDIHAVMDGALARCTGIIESHKGKVLQYAGDGLLAVFGADEAQEVDPERAVHAGLALLAEGRQQGEQAKRQHGHDGFDVRVGLHTGGVLLGGGVDAEGSIRGMTVNIAARMEQTAPAGALRISHETYRHVRGVFDVEAQPPIQVKGLDEPIVTYLVQRAKPRAFRVATRGIEGVETRMVGRDVELELLQDAFKNLYRQRNLAAVTVVAEAGLGKSRLLYEFENWAEARSEAYYIFQGRAQSQTQSHPYGLLRDVLAWRLQIADGDSMDVAKRKIEQGIAPLFKADDGDDMAQAHAHVLGHLIGLDFTDSRHIKGIQDDRRQIRNRGFHSAAQMFRRVAAQNDAPIVLLLDDLHWADDGSLDFLNYLTQVNRDVPMLMLGLTRPTLFERRADWPGTADAQRIELSPLDKSFSRLLANELLKKLPEIPAALRELITGGAEGNPFYMEELVKMLVDEGAIETRKDRWTVIPDKLLATHVPQTLTGVLQARLDSLKPSEKLVLQQASVIGFMFWDQALVAIDARAIDSLPALVQRELIVPHQDAGFEGVREYAFRHQILHQVTYDTVLKRTRRELHAKAAAWLAGLAGARANDFLGATAEHFEKAGDNPRACEFFARAAEHAAGRYAHEAAMGYVGQALALVGADSQPDELELRWRLLDVRERTLDLQGKRPEQQTDINALQGLADALGDDRRRGEVAWRRSDIAMRTADYRTMESAARQAMALAERAGAVELRLRAQQRVASALGRLGDAAAGKELAQDGLAAARAQGLRHIEARLLNTLSIIADIQGDLMTTLETVQQTLLIDRELGDRRSQASSLCNLGNAWLALGDHTQARRHLEEGLRLHRAVGNRAAESSPLINLSRLALRQGDDALALAHAQSAVDIAVAVQERRYEADALCWLGHAELALGRHAAAVAAFERAHAVALALDDNIRYDAAAGLARVVLAQGDVAGALLHLEELLIHLAGGGTLDGTEARQLVRLICHDVLQRAGDPRASGLLASAHTELQDRAATITDATLRHRFLNDIPEHREIVATWTAFRASTQGQE